jgi:hypothetical protein
VSAKTQKKATPKTEVAVQIEPPVSPEAEEVVSQEKTPLTQEEQQLLEQSEKTIAVGLGQFIEVGSALILINDHELYRIGFGTFEDYCQQRWHMSDNYAYRLINAARCVTVLKEKLTPQGVKTYPTNESQVRPLLELDEEKQPEAWLQVLKDTDNTQPTASRVQDTVNEFAGKPKSKKRGSPKARLEKVEKKLEEISAMVKKGLEANLSKEKLSKLLKQIRDLLD